MPYLNYDALSNVWFGWLTIGFVAGSMTVWAMAFGLRLMRLTED